MKKKKEAEQPKEHNPTPNLAIPRANRQLFTFSENKLLDQITTEIVEAWAKDLLVIKECHKETLKAAKKLDDVNRNFQYKFEKLDQFISEDWFIADMKVIIENQKTLFSFMEDVRQKMFSLDQKINFDYVKTLTNDIESVHKSVKTLIEKTNKKWWQFWK